MGFAEEVAQSQQQQPVLPTGGKEPAVEAAANDVMNQGMPEHGAIHPEQAVETPAPAPVEAAPKAGKIKIGSEVFDTPEEAIQYAEEMQRQILQKDAFEMGKQAALPKEEKPKEKDFFEELESEIFENPKEALRKMHSKAIEDAKKQIYEEKAREETRQQTWNSFYSANADLATQKQIVDYVLEKNWNEIANLPGEKGLRILAEKTRAFLGSTKMATLPTRELQSQPAVVPNGGSPAPKTTGKEKTQALDFISQINKHRKREATI